MLYLRTISGRFINSAVITQLSPDCAGDDAITGWIATCRDGETVALAAYFTLPGQIEPVLVRLLPVDAQTAAAALPCSSENCMCA